METRLKGAIDATVREGITREPIKRKLKNYKLLSPTSLYSIELFLEYFIAILVVV